jgi:hypothetical protein
MAIRIDVNEEGKIQIMRPAANGAYHHLKYDSVQSALNVIEHFIEQDLQRALRERFKPQLIKDAEKAYIELEGKSPYAKS